MSLHLHYVILPHFSLDRSNWSNQSFSSTTFQNFPGISDLLYEMFMFQHYRELCSKCSTSLLSSLKSGCTSFRCSNGRCIWDWCFSLISRAIKQELASFPALPFSFVFPTSSCPTFQDMGTGQQVVIKVFDVSKEHAVLIFKGSRSTCTPLLSRRPQLTPMWKLQNLTAVSVECVLRPWCRTLTQFVHGYSSTGQLPYTVKPVELSILVMSAICHCWTHFNGTGTFLWYT